MALPAKFFRDDQKFENGAAVERVMIQFTLPDHNQQPSRVATDADKAMYPGEWKAYTDAQAEEKKVFAAANLKPTPVIAPPKPATPASQVVTPPTLVSAILQIANEPKS